MISRKEVAVVRLEFDFNLILGELRVIEQNFLDHPPEKLIAMWADQIKQARLMVRLENHATISNKDRSRREDGTMG